MIGKTLAHYRFVEQIGAGGMGVVYRARDERLERDVALKVLPSDALTDEEARKRFRKEALALSSLNHPNIATVFDFDHQEGVDFLAMEFIAGESLAAKLPNGPLTEKEVASLGGQIASALEEAHEHGVVHRDLKPGNVMVTPKGHVKVLDFGLAKLLHPGGDADVTRSITETKAVSGTLPYMAPEQLRNEALDARTDLHALGAVLYEMATGKRVFAEESSPRLTDAILNRLPVSPRAVNARVSPELERIILKCLEKEPENRYQSAKELAVDLRRLGSPATAAALPAAAPTARRWQRIALPAGLAVLATLAVLIGLNVSGLRSRWWGEGSSGRIESLAVLPLNNFSHDPEQEYFADGMTEALMTDLAQIGALRVISRTSVMQYKGTHKSLPEIAKELHVDAVVEGSVQRVGNRVKITAQLIRAATDTHVWAKDYDRDLRDVLSMQSEVARAIANEIKIELTPNEKERLGKEHQVNPEAHDLYFRGRFALSRATDVKGIWKSIELFQQALAIDPNSAPAYAGLADAYESFGDNYLPPKETMPKGKMAAEKALALDETLAEAHNALAYVNFVFDWDFPGAEKQVRRALELNPNYAPAHDTYAAYLTALGRFTEADRESRRAVELDPFAVGLAVGRGWYLVAARQYDRAIELLRKTVDLEPNCGGCRAQLALALAFKGEFPAAIEEGRKGVQLDNSPLNLAFLCSTYALAGKTAETRQTIAQLKGMSKTQFVCPYEIGVAYLHLGETDEAFRWLERGYQQRSFCMVWLKVDQRWDLARNDPRLQATLKRLGLE